jgi:hypothetical protein
MSIDAVSAGRTVVVGGGAVPVDGATVGRGVEPGWGAQALETRTIPRMIKSHRRTAFFMDTFPPGDRPKRSANDSKMIVAHTLNVFNISNYVLSKTFTPLITIWWFGSL